MNERPTLQSFRKSVDALMTRAYGLDWQNASGEEEPLVHALSCGETAEEFVERFASKYGLDRVDEFWGGRALD